MPSTIRPSIGTSNSITITLNSLANNGARQSTAVNLPTGVNQHMDASINLLLSLPSTAAGTVNVFVAGSIDNTNYDFPATGGGDAGVTIANASNNMKLAYVARIATAGGTQTIPCPIESVASLFGGVLPSSIVLVVQNLSGQALAASANAATYYLIDYTVG